MSDLFDSNIFRDIDPYFVNKIRYTIGQIGNQPDIEIIGSFMALYNEANESGVKLSSRQQKALFQHLREELPGEKRQKFDLILSMISS